MRLATEPPAERDVHDSTVRDRGLLDVERGPLEPRGPDDVVERLAVLASPIGTTAMAARRLTPASGERPLEGREERTGQLGGRPGSRRLSAIARANRRAAAEAVCAGATTPTKATEPSAGSPRQRSRSGLELSGDLREDLQEQVRRGGRGPRMLRVTEGASRILRSGYLRSYRSPSAQCRLQPPCSRSQRRSVREVTLESVQETSETNSCRTNARRVVTESLTP
jgi:hypothetical protein